MLKKILKKTFNIREGEMEIALLMQLYIFLIITVLLLVKPTVTALFLSNLGAEKLPFGYLLVAVVAVFTSYFYNWLLEKFPIKIVAMSTIIVFAAIFSVLAYVVHLKTVPPSILYFYYMGISLFGVLVTSQFWVIANIVFDLREAKRLFGFIGAGAIAGGILGGYLTSFLARFFGNSMVIMVAASLLLVTLPIIMRIWKIRVEQLNKYIKEERKSEKKKVIGSSVSIIRHSKHLLYLSAVVGVSVVVAKLIDYEFNAMSHSRFPDSDELASFFGFWFSTFNIVSLLLQLFVTNRLLARFGVTTNLVLLPLSLTVGMLLFIVFPELWVLILVKGLDGIFKQSINKAAFELSILPIPFEMKKQAKPFIDVVVDSIATGFAGFLLLFLIKIQLGFGYITFIILGFLALWLLLIVRLRGTYFEAFRKNINHLIGKKDKTSSLKSNGPEAFYSIFETGDEEQILNVLENIDTEIIDVFKDQMVKMYDHPSDRVKIAVIKKLFPFKNSYLLKQTKNVIEHSENDELVYESMEYLLAHSDEDQEDILNNYLDHAKDYIKNAALLSLARISRYNKRFALKYGIEKRIEAQIEEFTKMEDIQREEELAELMITIAFYKKKKYYHFIDRYLASNSKLLKTYAIKAAGLTRYEPYIPKLLKLMNEDDFREEVVQALKRFGESIVTELYNYDRDQVFDDDLRSYIPQVIQVFGTKKSVAVLNRLLNSKSVKVRLSAARSLGDMEEKHKNVKISDKRFKSYIYDESIYFGNTLAALHSLQKVQEEQLKKAPENKKQLEARKALLDNLAAQLELSLKTIFYLLGIKYPDSDMQLAFDGIINKTEESRINSLEFLENMLQSDLKSKLLPLLEYHFLNEKDTELVLDNQSEEQVLSDLIQQRGVKTKMLVLDYLATIQLSPDLLKLVKKLTRHPNEDIRDKARKVLNEK